MQMQRSTAPQLQLQHRLPCCALLRQGQAARSRLLGSSLSKQRHCRRPQQVLSVAAAEAPQQQQEAQKGAVQPGQQVEWHAVLANAEFMLHDVQNESFAEQLRERRRYLNEKGEARNFWLVSEPAWLDERFAEQAKLVRRPCVALLSTDKMWIQFMKLRLDRVLLLDLGNMTPEEAFKSQAAIPDFPPLDRKKWTAPYPPYAPGWWKMFVPE